MRKAFFTPIINKPINNKTVIANISSNNPSRYLVINLPEASIIWSASSWYLSGVINNIILENKSASFRKKKVMNKTANNPIKKLPSIPAILLNKSEKFII